MLDDELDHLPDNQRLAFVFCCLEGKSYAEAAEQMGRPLGTVASWAARARQRLRVRLEPHRGVVGALVAVALGLTCEARAASLPTSLLTSTVRAVLNGTVSARSTALAEGLLQRMFLTKLMMTAIVLVAAAALHLGAGELIEQMRANEPGRSPCGRGNG